MIAPPILEPLTGGGPQPRGERQALFARLMDKPVAVFIGDYQLNSGHHDTRSACGYVYVSYTSLSTQNLRTSASPYRPMPEGL